MRINSNRGPKQVPLNSIYNSKQLSPDIRVKDLNTLIYHQGIRVKVYQTLWCPNVKSLDGAEHNINCPLCSGSGFIDVNPVDTFAVVQSQTREQNINPDNIGTNWEEQTVMATFVSDVELSYYTKVEFIDYTNIYKQLVQRQIYDYTVIPSFTPIGYNSSTGVVTIPDTIDTYSIKYNDIFIDADNNEFVIRTDIVHTTGAKSFKIDIGQVVSLGAGAIIKRPDVDRLQFKAFFIDYIVDQFGNTYNNTIGVAASFSGVKLTPKGCHTDNIIINANNIGTSGNSIVLSFDGIKTVDMVVAAWNLANPGNMVTVSTGGSQIPANLETISFSGGVTPITNFEIDSNGDIRWLSTGLRPQDKAIYTIHYNTIVAFRAIRALHSNRFGTQTNKRTIAEVTEYPQQWLLKKLFLFRKEDSTSGMRLDMNKLFPPGEQGS